MRYRIETYPPDGHTMPGRTIGEASTLDEARAIVRRHLGLSRLPRSRRWKPDRDSGAVEAYHDYPESHPQAYGCGGVAIMEKGGAS